MATTAHLYRMELPDHLCPSGIKLKSYLEKKHIKFTDHPLKTRSEMDAMKDKLGVRSTPQLIIDNKVIGGFEASLEHFGDDASSQKSYKPVIALFSIAALMAVSVTWLTAASVFSGKTIPWFISIAMILLGLQKLKDIQSFADMFLNYDLLVRVWPKYGKVYPFLETGAGLLMFAGVLTWLSALVALVFGSIGAFSVFKAVYIDKRELTCACVGGNTNVPLGFISLTENLMMVGMAVWMLSKIF